MSSQWQKVPLGEAVSFSNGASSPDRSENGSFIVYGSNGPIGRVDNVNALPNTIIIGRVGSYCGSLRFSKEPCWVTDNAIQANVKDDNSPEFFYYLMQTLNLHSWRGGSGQPLLNQRTLNSIPAMIPSPKEQRAIAVVFTTLDDKIEQNRRTGQALEKLARATFKAWFVDFEPVKAKAAGATSFPGMPPNTFAALPTRLTDSPLGPVPEGWGMRPLKEIVSLTMGQSPSSDFYNLTGEGLPFHQGVSDHGFRFPTRRVYCTVEGRIANAGDVLLSVRAPVGRINVADVRMVLGRGLAGMRHKHGHQSYLLYLMQYHFAEDDAVGDGTIYKSVNKDFLEAMPLISPPADMLVAFDVVAATMDGMIFSLSSESAKLSTLRDYLLPKLLSGEVRTLI